MLDRTLTTPNIKEFFLGLQTRNLLDWDFVPVPVPVQPQSCPPSGLVDRDNLIADNLIAANDMKDWKIRKLWTINEFRIVELERTHVSSKFKFK